MGARKLESDKLVAESIMNKIVSASGEEGLERYIRSNGEDLPPVKLTSQEMEMLKGGVSPMVVAFHNKYGAKVEKWVKETGKKIASFFD